MNIREHHNIAMEIADHADMLKAMKDAEGAIRLYAEAFEKEKEAAMFARENNLGEPTTSILIRSAASLAYNAKNYREAERMISYGLLGEPPHEIAEEMRDLLEMVNFKRHMEIKGVDFQEGDIQLVINGKGVNYGMARSEDVIGRIINFVKLTERTIERKSGKPFRKKGKVSKELKNYCEAYISVPRAGSLAFTVRFTKDFDSIIPGFSSLENVIEDITTNIQHINNNDMEALKMNIPDESYRSNFIGLTKELAPDGKEVSMFGITTFNNGHINPVPIQRDKKSISDTIMSELESSLDEKGKKKKISTKEITGVLTAANAIGNSVKISSVDSSVTLSVPDGLSDIVRNYWESEVKVRYRKESSKNILEIIESL